MKNLHRPQNDPYTFTPSPLPASHAMNWAIAGVWVLVLTGSLATLAVTIWAVIELVQWITSK